MRKKYSMSLTPMTKSDYTNSGGQVRQGYSTDRSEVVTDGIDSQAIFGGYDRSALLEGEESITRDNQRGYIKLPVPVLNYVLAGPNGSLLQKILGIKDTLFQDILYFREVILKDVGDTVPINPTSPARDFISGPEALLYLVEELDIEEAIASSFEKILDKALYSAKNRNSEDYYFGDFSQVDGTYKLMGNWYLTPTASARIKSQKEIDDLIWKAVENDNHRLVYLINLKGKETLRGMFLNYIMVTPTALRPKIDDRQDQFTKAYSKILKFIQLMEYSDARNSTLETWSIHYKKLITSVNELIYKSDSKKKETFSVLEKMKGKKGFIRGNLLAKRTDFSGRSIIVGNPKLSIDNCGIPEEMLPKLFRYHFLKELSQPNMAEVKKMNYKEISAKLQQLGVLDKVPVILNRAPTLHTLSMLAFIAVPSKSKAIELNPLVTTGYNADFDGDSMGVHVPLFPDAIAEAFGLMLPSRNLYHPANGKPILVPKMEMIFGLNKATQHYPLGTSVKSYSSYQEVYDDVYTHKVKVYDTVTCQGITNTAGLLALEAALPDKLRGQFITITSKTITVYTDALLEIDRKSYVKTVDALVQYGFRMAKLYAPTISVLADIDDEFVLAPFDEFYKAIEELEFLHQYGFEDDDIYQERFSEELEIIMKKVEGRIRESLGSDNGFLQLVDSGARGSIGNLQQIYSFKGQIQKSDYESFSAIIPNSFSTMLSPFQHFVSAYGTRKGLIDKVQKTAQTGYIGRLMYQAASDIVIKEDDCGTSEYITISKDDIVRHIKGGEEEDNRRQEETVKAFQNIVKGRYKPDGTFIDAKLAEQYAKDGKIESVDIRSPLTCKVGCCVKCYGIHLSTNRIVVKGTPVGFIGGQAIGEPGTQLTMRTFQKGGVAGKSDVTSNFDRMSAFINVNKISSDKFITYDPVAWGDGKVIEEDKDEYTKKVQIAGCRGSVILPIHADLKEYAEKGEGLCTIPGDHDMRELLSYSTPRKAQMYLFYALYTCYFGQADIDNVHFEVLVSSMTMHQILRNEGRPELLAGRYYTTEQLNKGPVSQLVYRTQIKSVRRLPLLKDSPFSNILMENFVEGISKSTVLGLEERLETQMSRLLVGVKPNLGTAYPNYIANRNGE